jgi:proline iminopeptidase
VLRGIFLVRKKEVDWFYQSGAHFIYPDSWQEYLNAIPEPEHGNLVAAYYKRLTSPDKKVQLAAAKAWAKWEGSTSKLYPDSTFIRGYEDDEFAIAFARIECHYFMHQGFFKSDGWLLENIDRIRSIPAVIVQGRYDVVCPAISAWDLHRAWPEAEFRLVPDCGHSAFEPGICRSLVVATDHFA